MFWIYTLILMSQAGDVPAPTQYLNLDPPPIGMNIDPYCKVAVRKGGEGDFCIVATVTLPPGGMANGQINPASGHSLKIQKGYAAPKDLCKRNCYRTTKDYAKEEENLQKTLKNVISKDADGIPMSLMLVDGSISNGCAVYQDSKPAPAVQNGKMLRCVHLNRNLVLKYEFMTYIFKKNQPASCPKICSNFLNNLQEQEFPSETEKVAQ